MKPITKTAWAGPLVYKDVKQIDHKATGEAMRQLRKSHRISLREVARRMKLSAPFVSDLELGRRNWDGSRALAFMSATTAAYIGRITDAQKRAHLSDFRIAAKGAPSTPKRMT
jgi:transcriptional regulator with XRE-family HTH domain